MESSLSTYLFFIIVCIVGEVDSQGISIVLNSKDTTSATFHVTDPLHSSFQATIEEFQCLDSSGTNSSCTYSKNTAKENPATFTWTGLIPGAQYTLNIIRLEVNNDTAGPGNPFSVTESNNLTFCAVPNPPDIINIVTGVNSSLINVTISPSSLGGQVGDYRMEVFYPVDTNTSFQVTGLTNGEAINVAVEGALLKLRAWSVDTCNPSGESTSYIEDFFMMPLTEPSGPTALVLVRKSTTEMCFIWNVDKEDNSVPTAEYNSIKLQLMQGNPLSEVAVTDQTVSDVDDAGSICVSTSLADPNQDVEVLFSLKHQDTATGLIQTSPTRNETFNLTSYNMVSYVKIVCDFDADNCSIDIRFIADILPWAADGYLNVTWRSETTSDWIQIVLTTGVYCTDNTGSGGTYNCAYSETAADTNQLSFDVVFCVLDTCLISLHTTTEGETKNVAGANSGNGMMILIMWLAMNCLAISAL